jgi:DNA recombination protein RmuC
MNPWLYLLLGALLGGTLAGLLGWWLQGRGRVQARLEGEQKAQPLVEELRQQLTRRESEINEARTQLTNAQTARAAAEAQREAAQKLLTDQRAAHDQNLREAKEAQALALDGLRDTFKALSADALKQTHPEFLRLANETFEKLQAKARGDLAERQEKIATLVKPLEENLRIYQQRLAQSESQQTGALAEVKKHLETLAQQSQALSSETLQLRRVLSSNQARGRWGEETLRRVIEAAGMSAHCDFSEQTQAGDSKPDLIVRLPGERIIIVDAKVPDLDFLEAMDAADEASRAAAFAAHATKLKGTIKALAERDYPAQFPGALDYVVLFVPAESLFSAALEGDRDLIVWAAARRILLATPASLIALLRSVSVSWQQHAQTENARAIAEAAQVLFERVKKFTEHFERIHAGLAKANAAYNDAVGSYERMVRPGGERLLKLSGAPGNESMIDLDPLPDTLRLPPAS